MIRLAAAVALALLRPGVALAWVGTFPVCVSAPQYARVEVVAGFGPIDCVVAAARLGDLRPAALLLAGFVMPVCAAIGHERATLYLEPDATDDAIIGHELRHAFPPPHSHPYLLPWISSPCDWQR